MDVTSDSMWDDVEDRLRRATVGRYDIEQRIGAGGMGAVFRAVDRLSRPVAVKVLAPQLLSSKEFEERFLREAKTVARLRHPNLIYIHDFDRADGLHYFVMSYVNGPSLSELSESEGPLPVAVVRAWLYQMCDALAYAHRQNVIHRDVKPSNVLIDADGRAILTDFGIAQEEEHGDLTRTGMIVGSPPYLSPERWNGERAGPSSDQYSLGVVAYEMLVGKPPFSGSTLAVMEGHANRPPPPLTDLRPDCPDDFVAFINRMLEKKTKDRWPSLEEAADHLGTEALDATAQLRCELAVRKPTAPVVGSLTVVARAQTIEQGKTLLLGADIVDSQGNPLGDLSLAWQSSDPAVATVTPEGVVVAHQPGVVEITALFEGHADRVSLRVAPRPLSRIDVSASSSLLMVGETIQLDSLATDADGVPLAKELEWSSDNPAVATISSEGLLIAARPGSVTVEATAEGIKGTCKLRVVAGPVAKVHVTPTETSLRVGESAALEAQVVRHDGLPADFLISWASDDVSVATVDPEGRVEGKSPGAAVIRATCEGESGGSLITVQLVRVKKVELTVDATRVEAGERILATAFPVDADGRRLDGRTLVWRATNPDVIVSKGAGEFEAVAAGSAEVIASCEGVMARVAVDVTAPTIAAPWPSPTSVAGASGTGPAEAPARTPIHDPPKEEPEVLQPAASLWSSVVRNSKRFALPGGVAALSTLVFGFWLASRGGEQPEPPPPSPALASLFILSGDSLQVGDSVPLQGIGVLSDGDTVSLEDARWSVAEASVIEIQGSYAVATAVGRATLRLVAGGLETSVALTTWPAQPVVAAGRLVVEARTSGDGADPNGYLIAVDGGPTQRVGSNGEVVVPSLQAGSRTVSLSGVGTGCALRGAAERVASITPGQATTLRFDVTCRRPVGPPPPVSSTGTLRVRLVGSFAFLYVDGVNKGQERLFEFDVQAGTRTLRIQRQALGIDTTFTVNVRGGATRTVEVDLRR